MLPTCDIEVKAVVAKGCACVEARVCQLHRLDLQLAVTDVRVFSIDYCGVVFGPVDGMGCVLGGAAQSERIDPREKG